MSTHKTNLYISIAAIVLLVAAAPSLAQPRSERSGTEADGSETAPAIENSININLDFTAVTKSRFATPEVERALVTNGARTTIPLVLSHVASKQQIQFTEAGVNGFVNQQLNFNDAGLSNSKSKKQVRIDNYTGNSRTRRVAFVPSRGQKKPE